jgi:hypothetical protein
VEPDVIGEKAKFSHDVIALDRIRSRDGGPDAEIFFG